MQVPPIVRRYFEHHPRLAGAGWHHPWVAQVYRPDQGWTPVRMTKRISPSWAASLRREGIGRVQLVFGPGGDRYRRMPPRERATLVRAEFTVAELTRRTGGV